VHERIQPKPAEIQGLAPASPHRKAFDEAIAAFLERRAPSSVTQPTLPPASIPFDPQPAPRPDLVPAGALPAAQRSEASQYLQDLFDLIVAGSPLKFKGLLNPQHFRFQCDGSSDRTAVVDVNRLEVTVAPSFFNRVQNDAHAAAIISHEVSHALLGHPDFGHPPPLVQAAAAYRRQQAALAAAQARLQPEKMEPVISRYNVAEQALRDRYEMVYPGRLGPLIEASRRATGETARRLRADIRRQQARFAASDRSREAREYLTASRLEQNLMARLERFNEQRAKLVRVSDRILGEPGTTSNWKEQEADELGFRLFLQAGFEPQAFLHTLATTLDDGTGALQRYWCNLEHQLARGVDPAAIPVPPRGTGNHPSPQWRIYNLAIRDRRLRYPQEYLELETAPAKLRDRTNPLGRRLARLRCNLAQGCPPLM
jgi:hypothetical protein